MGKHRFTVAAIGVLASALFMYFAVRRLDFASLAEVWRSAHLLPWLPLAVASYLAGHVVRGQRCRLLVRREANIGLPTASNIVVVGYASNNVFPARLGEFVRAGMLAERTGMPIAQSLAITFIERVLDGLAILFLLVVTTLAGDAPGWTQDLVRVALLVFGGATLVMFAGAHSPGLIVSAASRLGNKLGARWHDRLVSLASAITNAGACLRDPKDALKLAAYSLVVWTFEAGLFVAILPIFGLAISFKSGAMAMSVTNLGLLVPSSPGFIGPFHYFCSKTIAANGAPEAVALAYATVVHLAFYIPVTVWGAIAMLWYGVQVGATAAIAREAKRTGRTAEARGVKFLEMGALAPAPKEEPASAFTIGLIEALVVGEGQKADPNAVKYAATFVDGQLGALRPQLKLMFDMGMTFFRFVTRLRFLRGYCDVPIEARRAWTKRWAENRVTLFRQLFKPVRATGLLAYYDHEAVKKTLLAELVPSSRLVRTESRSADPIKAAEGA